MRRAILIACIVLVTAALVGAVIVMIYLYGPEGNAIHMRNVTRELAEWQTRYDGRELKNDREAKSMIEMLDYVQWYYVPIDNYRADAATEEALQKQRSATMEAIIAPLRRYSGEDYGTEVDRWRKWLNRSGGTKGQSPQEEKQEEKGTSLNNGASVKPNEFDVLGLSLSLSKTRSGKNGGGI